MRYVWLVILISAIFLSGNGVAFAANDAAVNQMIGGLAGFGGTFQAQVGNLSRGLLSVARFIVVILTATAACMIAFGIQDSKKTLWNWILGVGLAINFGDLVLTFWSVESGGAGTKLPDYKLLMKSADDTAIDILSPFMRYYIGIIMAGSAAVVPYAVNLTLLLATIDGTFKVAFDLISGDKIKYLVTMIVKVGFFIFLIHSWVGTNSAYQLMPALSSGFESMGYTAGGAEEMIKSFNAANPDSNLDVQSNQIMTNALNFFNIFWAKAKDTNILTILVGLVCVIAAVIILFLTALEMFMARIEFWTMSLITLVLLPFGVISQLKFLADKAIGAMFNLAIKIFVIAFIATMSVNILTSLVDNAKTVSAEADFIGNISYFLQVLLYALILYLITKKIPALVTGLLSGNPSLGGGDMKQMAMQAAQSAKGAATKAAMAATGIGAAAGVVKGLSVAAGNGGGFGSKAMSMMKQGATALGNAAKYRNPVYRGYQDMASKLGNKNNGLLAKNDQGKYVANADSGGQTPADMWNNIAPKKPPTTPPPPPIPPTGGRNQARPAAQNESSQSLPKSSDSAAQTQTPSSQQQTGQNLHKNDGDSPFKGQTQQGKNLPNESAAKTDNAYNPPPPDDYYAPPPDESYYPPPSDYDYPPPEDYYDSTPPPTVEKQSQTGKSSAKQSLKSAPKNNPGDNKKDNAKPTQQANGKQSDRQKNPPTEDYY